MTGGRRVACCGSRRHSLTGCRGAGGRGFGGWLRGLVGVAGDVCRARLTSTGTLVGRHRTTWIGATRPLVGRHRAARIGAAWPLVGRHRRARISAARALVGRHRTARAVATGPWHGDGRGRRRIEDLNGGDGRQKDKRRRESGSEPYEAKWAGMWGIRTKPHTDTVNGHLGPTGRSTSEGEPIFASLTPAPRPPACSNRPFAGTVRA